MQDINIYSKASRFSNITENPNTMAIFLSVANHDTRNYEQIIGDTKLDIAEVAPLVKALNEANFIEPNPNPLSNKFKLALNGQLFAEQLRNSYPEIKQFLGNRKLIKPVKINFSK